MMIVMMLMMMMMQLTSYLHVVIISLSSRGNNISPLFDDDSGV
jgi:hypothetical protein